MCPPSRYSCWWEETLAVGLVPAGDVNSGEMDRDGGAYGREEVLGMRVVKWWWAEVGWMANGRELAYLAFAWQYAAA